MNIVKLLLLIVMAVMLVVALIKSDKKREQAQVQALSEAVSVINAKLRNEYLKGFLDGASYQEVYRFHNPNTNYSPVIEIDRLMEEEMKAFDRTHGKKLLTNDMERINVES